MDEDTTDLERDWLQHEITKQRARDAQGACEALHLELLSACRASEDPKVAKAVTKLDNMVEVLDFFGEKPRWER